jgi:hypothetical protein
VETDEVMTSWRVTSEGCEDSKTQLAIEATCCVLPEYTGGDDSEAMKDMKYEVASEFSTSMNSDGALSALQSELVPFMASAVVSGPLVDTLVVEESASYVPRKLANGAGFPVAAFESVSMSNGDDDVNAKRFCVNDNADPTNLAAAFAPCKPTLSQAAPLSGSGNVFLKVTATLGVGFSADWGLMVNTYAFKGAMVVTKHGSVGDPILVKPVVKLNGEGLNQAQAVVHLTPGTYDVSLYGAYDAAGERAAKSPYSSSRKDAILFKQESVCDVKPWTLMTAANLKRCGGGEPKQADQPVAELPTAVVPVVAKKTKKTTKSAALTGLNREGFEGAFFSMKFGGPPAQMATDNYLICQGRFSLLGMVVEIDVSIKPGPAVDGGGMFMSFYFLWAVGSMKLGELSGNMTLLPFDFSKGLKGMADAELSLGISIKPHIFNIAMKMIEPIVKGIMMALLVPMLLLITVLQIALEVAIVVVEGARKIVTYQVQT